MGTIKLNKKGNKSEQFNGQTAQTEKTSGFNKQAKQNEVFAEELKNLRTVNNTVYRRNGKEYRKIISSVPTNYCGADGEYKEISNSLTDNGDEIVNKENSFKVAFNKDACNGKIFDLRKGTKKLTLFAAKPSKERGHACGCKCALCKGTDNTVTATLDDETEIRYEALNDRIKENIIVGKRLDRYEYNFTLDACGLTAEEGGHNNLLLKDAETGETQFIIPAPYMFDADNKFSDKVSYEIEVNGETLNIKVVADADFINAESTVLPVTIDPQIIVDASTAFKFETCYYNPSDPELSYFENELYLYSSTNDQTKETAEITIYKDKIKVDGTINSVKLKVTAKEGGSGYFLINGKESTVYTYQSGAFIFDITEDYVNTNGNFHIIFEGKTYYPEVQNSNVEFYANGQNAPQLIIDYVPNEPETGGEEEESEADKVPADKANIKRYKLGKNVAASVDINTGAVTCEINSFDGDGFVLPLNIVNSYRKGNGRNYVGENWKLNLWSKLKLAQEDMANKTVYTYTDELGDEHIFKEVYYYVDNGEKHFVYKNDVTIDVSGNLTYNGKRIIKHQICDNFTLVPVIDDFKNYQLIEQRRQEQIQLEDTVKAYEASLIQYVRVHLPELSINAAISQFNRYYCEGVLIGVGEDTDYIVLPVSSAYQLQSLKVSMDQLAEQITEETEEKEKQEALLEQTKNDDTLSQQEKQTKKEKYQKIIDKMDKEIELLTKQKTVMQNQSQNIISTARKNTETVKQNFINYFIKKAELELLLKHTPVSYLKDGDGTVSGFNKDGDLVCMFDAYGNTLSVEYDSANKIISVYDNEGKTLRFGYENGLLTSITDSRGRKTEYVYSGLNLQSVKFADGGFLNLKYQSNQIRSIETEDGLQYKFSYDADSRITEINTNSKPVTISRNVITEKDSFNKTLAKATFTYGEKTAEISEKNGHSESYVFDSGKKVKTFTEKDGAGSEAVTNYVYDYTDGKTVTATTVTKPDNETQTVINKFNDLDLPVSVIADWKRISETVRVKAETLYVYDVDENLTCEKTTEYIEENGVTTQTVHITNYRYNAQGSLVFTESYVEGEELTSGKIIEERVYDKNGNVTKTVSYNTLDSSSKFYTESEISENGQVKADLDETGARAAEYAYKSGTNVINSVTYPDGGTKAYGYDAYTDSLTSVTQSDNNGEANTTDILYTCGLPVEVKSGNTTIYHAYDYSRRKCFAAVNGSDYAEYTYKDYKYDQSSGKYEFGSTETTLLEGETTYTFTQSDTGVDTADGVVRTQTVSVDGTKLSEKKYNAKQQLESVDLSGIGVYIGTLKYHYAYAYDEYGNLTTVVIDRDVQPFLTESYVYNGRNELVKKIITEPIPQEYVYYYDNTAARKLSAVKFGGYTFKPLNDVYGRNTGKEILNGDSKISSQYITYRKVGDHATNMPATVWYGNGANIKDSVKYKYDSRGNICEIIENGHISAKYAYDSLNRLIREDNKPLNKTVLFTYDNNGNIVERCEYAYTTKTGEELSEQTCTHFSYDYDGDRLISYNGEECEYNNFGSPVKYRGKTLQWSYGKFLTRFDKLEFVYDGLGRRVYKDYIEFFYDSTGRLIVQAGDNLLEFIYDNEEVIGIKKDSTQYFYRKDAQGNITAILDRNGNVVVKYVYDAWGNHAVLDADGNDIEGANHVGNVNPLRYRGYCYDRETGLYYLGTRYYDPETGRFISQDGIEYADPQSINGLNLYAYCGNNPVMGYDPNGTVNWKKFWKRLGIVVGAIAVVATVTAAVVLTAGLAAVALGASAAVTSGIVVGAAVGGIAAGTYSIVSQSVNNGIDNLNIGAIALTTFGGSVIGAVIGGTIAFTGTTAGSLAVSGGGSVNVGSVAAKVGVLGAIVLFSKRDPSTNKPSWVNRDMYNSNLTPQENATNMLNQKYGIGNWKQGAGSEYSKIVKWIFRHILRRY